MMNNSVINLVNLVNYQPGSVVSMTLIDKPAGTVTLFAFDQGQGLSEHKAPFDALVYVLENRAEINIAGKLSTIEAGEFIVMPANKKHTVKATEKFKMLLIMIKS